MYTNIRHGAGPQPSGSCILMVGRSLFAVKKEDRQVHIKIQFLKFTSFELLVCECYGLTAQSSTHGNWPGGVVWARALALPTPRPGLFPLPGFSPHIPPAPRPPQEGALSAHEWKLLGYVSQGAGLTRCDGIGFCAPLQQLFSFSKLQEMRCCAGL